MFAFYDWPFPHMSTLQRMQPIVYSLLIPGSVFSDFVVFSKDMYFARKLAILTFNSWFSFQ